MHAVVRTCEALIRAWLAIEIRKALRLTLVTSYTYSYYIMHYNYIPAENSR